MKKWSRRKFLGVGVVGSIAIHGATAAGMTSVQEESKTQQSTSSPDALEERERDVLRLAMDEIIPAGAAMPAASAVGGMDYLDKLAGRDKEVAKKLRQSLGALEGLSKKRFNTSFLSLSRELRIDSLTALEKEDPDTFKALHDYVYEAYYTRPAVWKLVGYDFHPTNMSGPHMKPFDEAMLAEVRKKPKYYREV
jgi:hypothetical protein